MVQSFDWWLKNHTLWSSTAVGNSPFSLIWSFQIWTFHGPHGFSSHVWLPEGNDFTTDIDLFIRSSLGPPQSMCFNGISIIVIYKSRTLRHLQTLVARVWGDARHRSGGVTGDHGEIIGMELRYIMGIILDIIPIHYHLPLWYTIIVCKLVYNGYIMGI